MQTKALILLPLLAAVVMAGKTESKDTRAAGPSAVAVAKATIHANGVVSSKYAKQVTTVRKGDHYKKPSKSYGEEEEDEEEGEDDGYGEEEDEGEDDEGEDDEEEEDEEDSDAPANGSKSARSAKQFALYNHRRGKCLAVKRGRLLNRKDLYLRLVSCSLKQKFTKDSKMAFHWKPAHDNKLGYLAWTTKSGRELCGRSKRGVTKLYPCNSHSTKYSMSETNDKGRFRIRKANSWNSCIGAGLITSLGRTKSCGPFRTPEWESIPI
jgi:hypothetical protein